MFIKYLRNDDPELLNKAGDLDIDVGEFDPIFRLSASAAKSAVRQLIKERTKKASVSQRSPHVKSFLDEYARDVADFYRLRTKLDEAVEEYNAKHPDAYLRFFHSAENSDKLIRRYSPRGGGEIVTAKEYDLRSFLQKAKAEGYDNKLRVSPSGEPERDDYVFATLQANGTILYNKVSYPSVYAWVGAVYDAAIKEGTRTKSNRGNKMFATTIQNKNSGEWEGLGQVYNRLMLHNTPLDVTTNGASPDGAESEEETEEDTEE